ncbi:unnamed protein product [Closterium sp. Naga37s-1]|nr:unnamed protein product [Closterium sp. Naga37s-1]
MTKNLGWAQPGSGLQVAHAWTKVLEKWDDILQLTWDDSFVTLGKGSRTKEKVKELLVGECDKLFTVRIDDHEDETLVGQGDGTDGEAAMEVTDGEVASEGRLPMEVQASGEEIDWPDPQSENDNQIVRTIVEAASSTLVYTRRGTTGMHGSANQHQASVGNGGGLPESVTIEIDAVENGNAEVLRGSKQDSGPGTVDPDREMVAAAKAKAAEKAKSMAEEFRRIEEVTRRVRKEAEMARAADERTRREEDRQSVDCVKRVRAAGEATGRMEEARRTIEVAEMAALAAGKLTRTLDEGARLRTEEETRSQLAAKQANAAEERKRAAEEVMRTQAAERARVGAEAKLRIEDEAASLREDADRATAAERGSRLEAAEMAHREVEARHAKEAAETSQAGEDRNRADERQRAAAALRARLEAEEKQRKEEEAMRATENVERARSADEGKRAEQERQRAEAADRVSAEAGAIVRIGVDARRAIVQAEKSTALLERTRAGDERLRENADERVRTEAAALVRKEEEALRARDAAERARAAQERMREEQERQRAVAADRVRAEAAAMIHREEEERRAREEADEAKAVEERRRAEQERQREEAEERVRTEAAALVRKEEEALRARDAADRARAAVERMREEHERQRAVAADRVRAESAAMIRREEEERRARDEADEAKAVEERRIAEQEQQREEAEERVRTEAAALVRKEEEALRARDAADRARAAQERMREEQERQSAVAADRVRAEAAAMIRREEEERRARDEAHEAKAVEERRSLEHERQREEAEERIRTEAAALVRKEEEALRARDVADRASAAVERMREEQERQRAEATDRVRAEAAAMIRREEEERRARDEADEAKAVEERKRSEQERHRKEAEERVMTEAAALVRKEEEALRARDAAERARAAEELVRERVERQRAEAADRVRAEAAAMIPRDEEERRAIEGADKAKAVDERRIADHERQREEAEARVRTEAAAIVRREEEAQRAREAAKRARAAEERMREEQERQRAEAADRVRAEAAAMIRREEEERRAREEADKAMAVEDRRMAAATQRMRDEADLLSRREEEERHRQPVDRVMGEAEAIIRREEEDLRRVENVMQGAAILEETDDGFVEAGTSGVGGGVAGVAEVLRRLTFVAQAVASSSAQQNARISGNLRQLQSACTRIARWTEDYNEDTENMLREYREAKAIAIIERQRAAQTRTEINTSIQGLHRRVAESVQRAVAREYVTLLSSLKEHVKEGVDAAMGRAALEGRLRVVLPNDYMETMKKAVVANVQETLAVVKSAMDENCQRLETLKADILAAVDEKLSGRIHVGQVPAPRHNPPSAPHFSQPFTCDNSPDAALAAAANMVERWGFAGRQEMLESERRTETGGEHTSVEREAQMGRGEPTAVTSVGRADKDGERASEAAEQQRRMEEAERQRALVEEQRTAREAKEARLRVEHERAAAQRRAARAAALSMAESRRKRLEEDAARERADAERRQREMEIERKRLEDELERLAKEDEQEITAEERMQSDHVADPGVTATDSCNVEGPRERTVEDSEGVVEGGVSAREAPAPPALFTRTITGSLSGRTAQRGITIATSMVERARMARQMDAQSTEAVAGSTPLLHFDVREGTNWGTAGDQIEEYTGVPSIAADQATLPRREAVEAEGRRTPNLDNVRSVVEIFAEEDSCARMRMEREQRRAGAAEYRAQKSAEMLERDAGAGQSQCEDAGWITMNVDRTERGADGALRVVHHKELMVTQAADGDRRRQRVQSESDAERPAAKRPCPSNNSQPGDAGVHVVDATRGGVDLPAIGSGVLQVLQAGDADVERADDDSHEQPVPEADDEGKRPGVHRPFKAPGLFERNKNDPEKMRYTSEQTLGGKKRNMGSHKEAWSRNFTVCVCWLAYFPDCNLSSYGIPATDIERWRDELQFAVSLPTGVWSVINELSLDRYAK